MLRFPETRHALARESTRRLHHCRCTQPLDESRRAVDDVHCNMTDRGHVMLITADEIARSLSGSLKLLNRDEEGLKAFEISIPAFWRSFGAILLTAPAFVVALADGRVEQGLPSEAGLFSSP